MPEGAAVLSALADAPLPSALSRRRGALRAAAATLDPRAPPADAPPPGAYGDLPGAGALRALALLRAGRAAEALDLLAGAPDALDRAPPALRARVLPPLLEAALAADRPLLAAALRGRLDRVAGLAEPGAAAFLAARAAAAAGNDAAAAAGFAAAAAAGTVWGHRARLAGIDLGLPSGAPEPAAALEALGEARALWRGDDEALDTLRRAARLAGEAGDARAAAEALGEIWWRGGRRPEDAAAALGALRAFYEAGASGRLTLPSFMEGHRRLAGPFRLLPGHAALAEGFADHLLARGATGAAAAEYADAAAHLLFGAERGLWPAAPARLDALRLKEAEAHLAGGRPEAAAPLLEGPLRAPEAGAAARLDELRLRRLVLSGEAPAEGAPATSGADPGLLARAARGHVIARRWGPALDAYRALWDATGGAVPAEDAGGALLAAHHGGDEEMRARAERALAAAGGARAAMAEGGLAPEGDPGALGAARLRGALGRSEDALRASARLAEAAAAAGGPDGPADVPAGGPAADRGGINTSLTDGP